MKTICWNSTSWCGLNFTSMAAHLRHVIHDLLHAPLLIATSQDQFPEEIGSVRGLRKKKPLMQLQHVAAGIRFGSADFGKIGKWTIAIRSELCPTWRRSKPSPPSTTASQRCGYIVVSSVPIPKDQQPLSFLRGHNKKKTSRKSPDNLYMYFYN